MEILEVVYINAFSCENYRVTVTLECTINEEIASWAFVSHSSATELTDLHFF